ncbi:MAG: hypothetical protein RJQ00_13185 [Vicingaceae bacterium]
MDDLPTNSSFYDVTSGSIITATATSGLEFRDADIVDLNGGCLFASISSAFGGCVSCGGANPSNVTNVSTTCPPVSCTSTTISADWLGGCPVGINHGKIEIF